MLLSGNSNKSLSQAVEKALGGSIVYVEKNIFPDGEINLKIQPSMDEHAIFLLQATSPLVTENLMELLLTLEGLKQQGAKQVIVLMSYFGYARQDQQDVSGICPLKSVAHLIEAAGASEIIVLDPHWKALQSPFSIPCVILESTSLMASDMKAQGLLKDTVLVAPDQGAIPRVAPLAGLLGLEVLCLEKKRGEKGEPYVMGVSRDLSNQKCVIVDDIIDSGKTLCEAVKWLENQGAKDIRAYVTHGVLSPGSHQRLEISSLKELVITDSVQVTPQTVAHPKIRQISVAPLMAGFIKERVCFGKDYASAF